MTSPPVKVIDILKALKQKSAQRPQSNSAATKFKILNPKHEKIPNFKLSKAQN
jgi:hypothetical protein